MHNTFGIEETLIPAGSGATLCLQAVTLYFEA